MWLFHEFKCLEYVLGPSTFGKRNPAGVESWHSNMKSDAPTITLALLTPPPPNPSSPYLTRTSYYSRTSSFYCFYKIGPSPATTLSFFVTLVHEDKVIITRVETSQYSAICSGISVIFTLLWERLLLLLFVITGDDELPRCAIPGWG